MNEERETGEEDGKRTHRQRRSISLQTIDRCHRSTPSSCFRLRDETWTISIQLQNASNLPALCDAFPLPSLPPLTPSLFLWIRPTHLSTLSTNPDTSYIGPDLQDPNDPQSPLESSAPRPRRPFFCRLVLVVSINNPLSHQNPFGSSPTRSQREEIPISSPPLPYKHNTTLSTSFSLLTTTTPSPSPFLSSLLFSLFLSFSHPSLSPNDVPPNSHPPPPRPRRIPRSPLPPRRRSSSSPRPHDSHSTPTTSLPPRTQ